MVGSVVGGVVGSVVGVVVEVVPDGGVVDWVGVAVTVTVVWLVSDGGVAFSWQDVNNMMPATNTDISNRAIRFLSYYSLS